MPLGADDAWAHVAELMRHFLQLGSGAALLARTRQPPCGPHIFASPVRVRILELLAQKPAIPLAELRQRLPAGWGNLRHHLGKLVDAGLVRVEAHGRRRVVVATRAHVPEAMIRGIALLRGATLRRIATYVAQHPGATIRDLRAATGESRRTVYYHVKQLRDAGLLQAPTPRRYFELRATPDLEALLLDAWPNDASGGEASPDAGPGHDAQERDVQDDDA